MTKRMRIALTLMIALSLPAGMLLAQAASEPSHQATPEKATDNTGQTSAATPASNPAGGGGGGSGMGGNQMWLFAILIGVMVVMFVFSSRGRKKEEAKRKEMLSSLKKGDKVVMIGGEIGTVIEVKDDEVVVKVDETNNIRVRYARWAIRGVGEEGRADAAQSSDNKK